MDKKWMVLGALCLLALGSTWISPSWILEGLYTHDRTIRLVVVNLRLPRILMAILVGASLSVSGALLQAVMRNPLADPGMIGFVGPNGSGKSTVLKTLTRLLPCRKGTVNCSGVPLQEIASKVFARQVGILPQQPAGPCGRCHPGWKGAGDVFGPSTGGESCSRRIAGQQRRNRSGGCWRSPGRKPDRGDPRGG
ncbi:iron chelate uptake ABC transporter family permease subunit [uncultured Acidaminococcus sp.]|uniref:iron chelate uptake ABC transporter family permease subunit n=1 Tax=uncultured Acidaminococcus sp. TaxID=352152 RepID=UPI002667181E|nr:iron chelate uptake ABC transporter family permease subunit [uncultured Acidaminococcus sp.]